MTPADITAIITAATALVAAVATLIHSIRTRKIATSTANSMQAATTGAARRGQLGAEHDSR